MPNSAAKGESPEYQGCHYILRIKEHLSSNWSAEFEGLAVTYTPNGETDLSGFIPDQSALHGLLVRIRDLNLTLISVNRVAIDESPEGEIGIAGPRANLEQ